MPSSAYTASEVLHLDGPFPVGGPNPANGLTWIRSGPALRSITIRGSGILYTTYVVYLREKNAMVLWIREACLSSFDPELLVVRFPTPRPWLDSLRSSWQQQHLLSRRRRSDCTDSVVALGIADLARAGPVPSAHRTIPITVRARSLLAYDKMASDIVLQSSVCLVQPRRPRASLRQPRLPRQHRSSQQPPCPPPRRSPAAAAAPRRQPQPAPDRLAQQQG